MTAALVSCRAEQEQGPLWHDIEQPQDLPGSMGRLGMQDGDEEAPPGQPSLPPLRSRCGHDAVVSCPRQPLSWQACLRHWAHMPCKMPPHGMAGHAVCSASGCMHYSEGCLASQLQRQPSEKCTGTAGTAQSLTTKWHPRIVMPSPLRRPTSSTKPGTVGRLPSRHQMQAPYAACRQTVYKCSGS